MTAKILDNEAAISMAKKTQAFYLMQKAAIAGSKKRPLGFSCGYLPEIDIWLGVHVVDGHPPNWIGFVGGNAREMGERATDLLRALDGGPHFLMKFEPKPTGQN